MKWLCSTMISTMISICDILKKYPVFGHPKWLLHEFNKMQSEDIQDTMSKNWGRVCEQLQDDYSKLTTVTYVVEKKVLHKIEKNVYHRQTALPITITEACGDINDHFKSKIMEPRLVVFENDSGIVQMFIVGEDDSLLELPANTIGGGITYLMAAYYVFHVQYPKPYQSLLYFFQDFVMDKADNGKRPTRYASFASTITM